MERGARAMAWLDGRDYVSPDDVQAAAPLCQCDVRHLTSTI
jgi:MoxR-like ATPase